MAITEDTTTTPETPQARPDLLDMCDEAGVIYIMFHALHMMADGISDTYERDAVGRIVSVTQDRFEPLKDAIERLHEMSKTEEP